MNQVLEHYRTQAPQVTGVVLAGGLSRRMGKTDKFLLPLDKLRLIDHVIERAAPQVGRLLINANGDPDRLDLPGRTIVPDPLDDGGPLAGLLATFEHVSKFEHMPKQEDHWLMTFAADTPFFPRSLVKDMLAIADNKQVVYAQQNDTPHYTFALWSTQVMPTLQQAYEDGVRSLHKAISFFPNCTLHCNASDHTFFNVNTPAELEKAKQYLHNFDS